MCNNKFKNLIIIGNGFDKSLHLSSSFSDYLLEIKHKVECDKIFYFIKKYNDYAIDLGRKINKACNSIYRHVHIRPLFDANNHHIDSITIAYDYFNIRLCLRRFIVGYSDLSLNLYSFKDVERHSIIKERVKSINKIGTSMFHDLDDLARRIDVNFWYLIIVFQKYRHIKRAKGLINLFKKKYKHRLHQSINHVFTNKNFADIIIHNIFNADNKNLLKKVLSNSRMSQHTREFIKLIIKRVNIYKNKNSFNNWSDVENTIKYFMMAQYDMPHNHADNFHSINYYFGNSSLKSTEYFDTYVYTCELINSLDGAVNDYPTHINDFSHIRNIKYKHHSVDVFALYYLYKYLMHGNNYTHKDLYMRDILSPYQNNYNIQFMLDKEYTEPLVFLLQKDFTNELNLSDMSFDNLFEHKYPFKYNFFIKQISRFEKDFGKYLTSLLASYPNYVNKSTQLLKNLASVSNKLLIQNSNVGCDNSFGVIDFNYTPLNTHVYNKNHIHGSLLNNDMIIGIGDTDIYKLIDKAESKIRYMNKLLLINQYKDNDVEGIKDMINEYSNNIIYYSKLLKLSKTNRILGLNKRDIEDSFTNKSLDAVKNIVFFGHSFGVNDYPYFEAIFDKTHIYNSDVRIIFCYTKFYKGDNSAKRKDGQIPHIIRMLNTYSRTFTNHNHGENLISKMLLENRLLFCDVSQFFGY